MNRRMWVEQGYPQARPKVEPVKYEGLFTHVASHPLVGYEDLVGQTTNKIWAIGYSVEGTLAPHGEEVIDDDVLSWLANEQLIVPKVFRFALTNCPDVEMVETWQRQLCEVNVSLHHTLRLSMPATPFGQAEIISSPELRMPNEKLYIKAGKSIVILSRRQNMAFVSSKIRDVEGAHRAGYGTTVLTPRYGESDPGVYRYLKRPTQWLYMAANSIKFALQSHEDEAQNQEAI